MASGMVMGAGRRRSGEAIDSSTLSLAVWNECTSLVLELRLEHGVRPWHGDERERPMVTIDARLPDRESRSDGVEPPSASARAVCVEAMAESTSVRGGPGRSHAPGSLDVWSDGESV